MNISAAAFLSSFLKKKALLMILFPRTRRNVQFALRAVSVHLLERGAVRRRGSGNKHLKFEQIYESCHPG